MKAAIYNQYGAPEVVSIQKVEKPTPSNNEILVKVKASTLTPGDSVMRKGEPLVSRFIAGLSKPKNPILGHEFAGEIVEVGKNITKFEVGDRIFGSLGFKSGSHAEYLSITEEHNVVKIPENISFEQAAAAPVGALTALFFLRKGQVESGKRVLIYGASGSVGTFAVQLARHFGAEVTAVCSSANIEFVKSLGANQAIDYKTEDFTKGTQTYDLIFDTVGKLNYNPCKKVLHDDGYFVTTAVKASLLIQMAQANLSRKKRIFSGITKGTTQDFKFITDLLAQGKIHSVIDRTYLLDEIVNAHEYVDSRRKKGNVIISMN